MVNCFLGLKSSFVDLFEAFPTGRGEGGGKIWDAELLSL